MNYVIPKSRILYSISNDRDIRTSLVILYVINDIFLNKTLNILNIGEDWIALNTKFRILDTICIYFFFDYILYNKNITLIEFFNKGETGFNLTRIFIF